MEPWSSSPATILTLFVILLSSFRGLLRVGGTTFTFVNKCGDTVWPGLLANSGSPALETTGFELPSGATRSMSAPTGWSGRFWARTGCSFDSSGRGTCATGDCGSGAVECGGAGAAPPATLAEFTLGGSGGQDFYDVSLVDGYNLPVLVEVGNGNADGTTCATTGCAADLNRKCPAELKVGDGQGAACRSACEAFGTPEYCCSGAYANPGSCRPSVYSEMFKSACPKSYSYAFDDPTSTFTCVGPADYSITFCPASTTSLKSTTKPTAPRTKGMFQQGGEESWLASLATGDAAPSTRRVSFLHQVAASVATTTSVLLLFLL